MHHLQDQPVLLSGGLGAAGVALGDALVLRVGVAVRPPEVQGAVVFDRPEDLYILIR